MGVPHEPRIFEGRAVSPRHLFLMCFDGWRPPEGTHVVVMTRNPMDQVISAARRWRALGNYETRQRDWLRRLPAYLSKLDELLKEHRSLLQYEHVTRSHKDLVATLHVAGLPSKATWSSDRLNMYGSSSDIVYPIPSSLRRAALLMHSYYQEWIKSAGQESPWHTVRAT